MKEPSINDLGIETLQELQGLKQMVSDYNDYGSILGARDESELIEKELNRTFNAFTLRIARLKQRIRKWENQELEVNMINEVKFLNQTTPCPPTPNA